MGEGVLEGGGAGAPHLYLMGYFVSLYQEAQSVFLCLKLSYVSLKKIGSPPPPPLPIE